MIYLTPESAPSTAGRFYTMPKVHKAGNPGRPICSGNNTAINMIKRISEYVVDYHIRLDYLLKKIPSYIQDTTPTDIFKKLSSLNDLRKDIMLTMDVISLYKHSSRWRHACLHWSSWWQARQFAPSKDIAELMKLILECSNFTFNDKYYRQLYGVSSWA